MSTAVDTYFQSFNSERFHQALDYRTPEQVYRKTSATISDAVPPHVRRFPTQEIGVVSVFETKRRFFTDYSTPHGHPYPA